MEEIVDIYEWFENYKPEPIVYLAQFDPTTGKVSAVGPSHAFPDSAATIEIEAEVAEMIIEGRINIDTCSVDVTGDELVLSETRAVYKIDDVLHRIVELEHAEFDKPNIYITYENNALTIELTEEFGGTRKVKNPKKKKINWAGNTEMSFLISDYNDPNMLYNVFAVTLSSLSGDKVVIPNLELPKKFSIYTRRLFKNYVLEIK